MRFRCNHYADHLSIADDFASMSCSLGNFDVDWDPGECGQGEDPDSAQIIDQVWFHDCVVQIPALEASINKADSCLRAIGYFPFVQPYHTLIRPARLQLQVRARG